MDDSIVARSAMRRIGFRLVPFLILAYFVSFLDRVNVGFAGLEVRQDLGLNAATSGGSAMDSGDGRVRPCLVSYMCRDIAFILPKCTLLEGT